MSARNYSCVGCTDDAVCLLISIILMLLEQLTVFQKLNRGKDLTCVKAGKLSWSHITESLKFSAIHCAMPKKSAPYTYNNCSSNKIRVKNIC